jgi:hypothetical protein
LVSFMPRVAARFRFSIKYKKTGTAIKVELIEVAGLWGQRRYRIRLNSREPAHVRETTLTEVFERPLDRLEAQSLSNGLRRCVVKRAGRDLP